MQCPKCGADSAPGDQFCAKCGAPLEGGAARAGSTMNIEPNVAGLLCYLLWWITGLVFILMEKENKFVRFHAMQSIITFGGLTVVWVVLSVLSSIFWPLYILGVPVWIASVVLWIVLMVKAYQGEKFKLPTVGEIAEKNSL